GMEGPPPDPPTQHWFPVGACTLSADGVKKDEGSYSLIATGRASTSDGPAQDVTGKVVSGLVYGVSVRARTVGVNDQGRITLTVTSSIDGVLSWSTSWSAVEAGKFKTLEGLFVPTWNGVATSVTWRVETKNTTDDLGIDTAALVEQTPYGFVRTIHREVLSPNHNPFGAGTTNPEGIYIIDLQGGILSLQRTRISGTLVVLNGPVYVWAVVHWAPAVSNYPALLSNTEINFWLGNDGSTELNEAKANTNYNPLGTPYAGWSDADMLDTYPALMRGIVYSTNDVKLRYRPVLEGVVLADNDIISEATDVGGMSFFDVTYLSHYYRDAPPGFTATPVVTLSHGSIRRVVD
ncbi:MAG: hypothetical protein HKN62_10115, partial [Phycisphaerales bacterium]|nr:hypothetical protein [Phycisphaerales bacterium]